MINKHLCLTMYLSSWNKAKLLIIRIITEIFNCITCNIHPKKILFQQFWSLNSAVIWDHNFCQSKKQNGGNLVFSWEKRPCVDICNGKPYFVDLLENTVDWHKHIWCHTVLPVRTPLSISLLCLWMIAGMNSASFVWRFWFIFFLMSNSFKFEKGAKFQIRYAINYKLLVAFGN